MAWWLGKYNDAISGLKVAKTDGAIVIAFDINIDAWGKVPAVNQCFPLLVRVFDEDGQHLTHFTTSEVFTANENVFEMHNGAYERVRGAYARAGQQPPADAPPKPILLNEKNNVFPYPLNKRDLRDAAIVEVGFYERPGR